MAMLKGFRTAVIAAALICVASMGWGQTPSAPGIQVVPPFPMLPNASNATLPAARNNLLPGATTALYLAKDYNGAISGVPCIWDAAHDVGDCVNAAIAAAVANGGGTVLLPAGTYGESTEIINNTSLVRLVSGAGSGGHHDVGMVPTGGTVFKWIGSAGGTMLTIAPVSGASSQALTGVDVQNITFQCDGTSTAGTGLSLVNIRQTTFDGLTAHECSTAGIHLDMNVTLGESTGNTQNTFNNIETDNIAAGAAGVGILEDKSAAGDSNLNNWYNVSVFFKNAPGIRMVRADNEHFYGIKYFRASGGTAPCAVDFGQSYAYSLSTADVTIQNIAGSAGSGTAYPFCAIGTGGTDGVSNTDTTYSSATGDFSLADVAQGITGTNIAGGTTVATYVDPQHLTLSQATTGTGTGLAYTVTGRTASLRNSVYGIDLSNGEGMPPLVGTGATVSYGTTGGRLAPGGALLRPIMTDVWTDTATAESRAAGYSAQSWSAYLYNLSQNHLILDDSTTRWLITEDSSHNLKFAVVGGVTGAVFGSTTGGTMALDGATMPTVKGTIALPGATSGTINLQAPAVASGTLTLPAGTSDLSATGVPNGVVQQGSAGAPLTVAALTAGQTVSQIPVTWGNGQFTQSGGGTDYYCGAQGGSLLSTFNNCESPWPITGHFKTLYAQLSAAPGGVQTVVLTLEVGAYGAPSDTALTCTITGAAQSCNLTGQNVAITAGQIAACKVVFSATATSASVGCSLEFDTP